MRAPSLPFRVDRTRAGQDRTYYRVLSVSVRGTRPDMSGFVRILSGCPGHRLIAASHFPNFAMRNASSSFASSWISLATVR